MTIYAPRTVLFDGGVLVADDLMHEFNRAEYATSNIDQNNVRTADSVPGVTSDDVVYADTPRACSWTEVSHQVISATNSSLQTLSPGAPEKAWTLLYETQVPNPNTPLEITFTSDTQMELFVACSGTLVASGAGLLMAQVRILVDGQPLDSAWSDSVKATGAAGKISWCVDGRRVLQPGSHSIRGQIRERGAIKGGTIAANAMYIFAYGLVR